MKVSVCIPMYNEAKIAADKDKSKIGFIFMLFSDFSEISAGCPAEGFGYS